jgi:hypothetical protein
MLGPYFGLIGSIITALVAWFAITRKIRFSTLHEKRALVIEEMYSYVVGLREGLKPLGGYDLQDLETQKSQIIIDSKALDAAYIKFEAYYTLKVIYFDDDISKILALMDGNALHVCAIYRAVGWTVGNVDELSEEEMKNKIKEAREKSEVIISEIKTLENRLKLEFQKLLGVKT